MENNIDRQSLLDSMKNLLETSHNVGIMLEIKKLTGQEPSEMDFVMDGVKSGTQATICAIFFRLFHKSETRDEMLSYVGIDKEMYDEVSERAIAHAQSRAGVDVKH